MKLGVPKEIKQAEKRVAATFDMNCATVDF